MNYRTVPQSRVRASSTIDRKLLCLLVCIGCSVWLPGQNAGAAKSAPSSIRGTHIMGFEGAANGATGTLSIEGDALQFQKAEGPAAKLSLASIQDVLLSTQDKQVGGTPLALGRAAAPFGGGRAVALFSHKKYDTVTLEYVDADGGYHGAIFQLNTGKGEVLKSRLVAGGVHVSSTEDQSKSSAAEAKNEKK